MISSTRLLRVGVAVVWLVTGVGVLFPSYRAVGAEYLGELGLPLVLMWVACVLEVGLAVFLVVWKPTTVDAVLQIGAVAFFTVVLAVVEPMLLVHPFGVLTKNVPLVCCVLAGLREKQEWVLRVGVGFVWLTEGILPKIVFQQPAELEVVANSGLVPFDASVFLVVLGVVEAVSGILVLSLRKFLKPVLIAQAVALVIFPVLITIQDPAVWVHPFGPMIKNVPILAATLVLIQKWS